MGIAATLVLILLSPYISQVSNSDSNLVKSFIHAALYEKITAMIFILIAFRNYPNFSITEATLTGMSFALGFSATENIFYAHTYGISHSIARIFFSVPMHLITCGILANYLGQGKFSRSPAVKINRYVLGLIFAFSAHGFFDYFLISSGMKALLIVPLLITLILVLEILLTRAQIVPGYDVLKALNIDYEDWQIMWKQPRYERWISDSMGRESTLPVTLFIWRPGFFRFLLFIFFIILAFSGFLWDNKIMNFLSLRLSHWDQILFLHIFPISLSLATVIVGSINPDFYKYRELKIPIMIDLVLKKSDSTEDTFISYDLSFTNCFIRTYEPIGTGNTIEIRVEISGFKPVLIKGIVVWERHIIGQRPTGSIIRIVEKPKYYLFFITRYYIYRIYKGIVFLLKLPGFEKIRKLFVHPSSTMQNDIYLKSGETIYKQGDDASNFYLLKKGVVETFKIQENGEIITIDNINEGSIFGEVSVVLGRKRQDSAIAVVDSILAMADIHNLQALLRNNSDIAVQLYHSLSERIYKSEQILMDYISQLSQSSFEKQRILDSLSFFLLIILGNRFDFHQNGYDLSDIRKIISKMDDKVSMDLAGILLMEKNPELETEELFKMRLLKEFKNFIINLD